MYTLRLLNHPDGCEDMTWNGSPLAWDTKLCRQLTVNQESHSKKWRSLHKVGVPQHQLRLEIPGDTLVPSTRARISTSVRCNTQATFFSLCRRSVHSKSQQNKNPKNTTNQSKGFTTASFQDRCCSFQEQRKSFIIKKQGKKKQTNKTQTEKQCASVKLRRRQQGSI